MYNLGYFLPPPPFCADVTCGEVEAPLGNDDKFASFESFRLPRRAAPFNNEAFKTRAIWPFGFGAFPLYDMFTL